MRRLLIPVALVAALAFWPIPSPHESPSLVVTASAQENGGIITTGSDAAATPTPTPTPPASGATSESSTDTTASEDATLALILWVVNTLNALP
jgi:hypothetical protein